MSHLPTRLSGGANLERSSRPYIHDPQWHLREQLLCVAETDAKPVEALLDELDRHSIDQICAPVLALKHRCSQTDLSTNTRRLLEADTNRIVSLRWPRLQHDEKDEIRPERRHRLRSIRTCCRDDDSVDYADD